MIGSFPEPLSLSPNQLSSDAVNASNSKVGPQGPASTESRTDRTISRSDEKSSAKVTLSDRVAMPMRCRGSKESLCRQKWARLFLAAARRDKVPASPKGSLISSLPSTNKTNRTRRSRTENVRGQSLFEGHPKRRKPHESQCIRVIRQTNPAGLAE